MIRPTIVAHGGAWFWDDALDGGKKVGLEAAVAIGYRILRDGGSALDAIEQTVTALEDNPIFDAGTGGYLNQAGVVQLDALIVDGSRHDFGAVGAVSRVRNPISLARQVMTETQHCFIVGAGADQLADELGIELIDNAQLVTDAMREFYEARRTDGKPDTVGAVAIDANGNTAAATSTSGVIVVDGQGNVGAAHTTPKLAVGWVDGDGKIRSSMSGADCGRESGRR